jgi:hypothetical protein
LKTSGNPFRIKKDRTLELASVFHECLPGRRKLAVKVKGIKKTVGVGLALPGWIRR